MTCRPVLAISNDLGTLCIHDVLAFTSRINSLVCIVCIVTLLNCSHVQSVRVVRNWFKVFPRVYHSHSKIHPNNLPTSFIILFYMYVRTKYSTYVMHSNTCYFDGYWISSLEVTDVKTGSKTSEMVVGCQDTIRDFWSKSGLNPNKHA